MTEEKKIDEEIVEDETVVDKCEEPVEEEIVSELDDIKSQLTRLQADFSNYRKRTEKERADGIAFGVKKLAMQILPVVDNFERALSNEAESQAFYEGVDMIYKQLKDSLKASDIVELEAVGKEFDPTYHYAVMMVDSEEHPSGTVIEVLQTGYTYHEQVIRPAMVKVAN